MNRPRGLTIIGWLAVIGGVLQILGSLGFFGLASFGMLIGSTGALTIAAAGVFGLPMWIGAGFILFGALGVVLGYGILQERPWSWTVGIVVYILNLLGAIALLALTGIGVTALFVGVLSAVILGYLYSPTAREALGHGTGGGISAGTPHAA